MTTHFSAGLIKYKDVISGDEMFSDMYKIEVKKFYDYDLFYEVEGRMVTPEFDNPEYDMSLPGEDPVYRVVYRAVDIVLDHHLQQTNFTKDQYFTYIKEYGSKIAMRLHTDRVRIKFRGALEHGMKTLILGHFKDWEFFTGESKNSEGMVALLNYRSDDVTPYMLFIKDGLEEEKA
eukprot:XP_002599783.1 hypothetical protein BRAFLDRAFT_57611 [Branchiostoma floridae]